MYVFYNEVLENQNSTFIDANLITAFESGETMAMIENNRRYIRRCAENIICDYRSGKLNYIKLFIICLTSRLTVVSDGCDDSTRRLDRTSFFRVRGASFHIYSPLLTFFLCFFV